MNDLDNELTRILRRHADNLPDEAGVPLAFDDVRGKATSIRRRRQLATGVGIAAAVAVIVPTAMFATQNMEADSPAPADNTPTVIDTNGADETDGPRPSMGADPGTLDVAGLPTGAEPAIPLVSGGDLARVATGEAVVSWTPEGVVVKAGGQTFGPYPSSTGLARNQAATTIAWATDEGDIMAWSDGGDEPFVVGRSDLPGPEVAAITGTSCIPGETSDCLFYVSGWNEETNQSLSFTLTPDGEVGRVDPEGLIAQVADATDDGRVLGLTKVSDGGSCSALIDPAASASGPALDTCDHTLEAFSPSGDFMLASEPYHSGIGSGVIAVYDARTGELLAERVRRDEGTAFYNSAVWEDDTHVLFTAYQDGEWSVVRMDVTGAMEYAVEPQKGNAEKVPWHFEVA